MHRESIRIYMSDLEIFTLEYFELTGDPEGVYYLCLT